MFTWVWAFGIVLFAAPGDGVLAHNREEEYTCEEFERGAHFDPYRIVDSMWKIFYFWGNTSEIYPIVFTLPSPKSINKFKETIDAVLPWLKPEWSKATLFMDVRPGVRVLFLYAGTPGAFRGVVKMERRTEMKPYPPPLVKLADIRIKIVGRYIGMMCCEDLTMYAMARMDDMPETERGCADAARTVGFRGPGGRSYLTLMEMVKNRDEL